MMFAEGARPKIELGIAGISHGVRVCLEAVGGVPPRSIPAVSPMNCEYAIRGFRSPRSRAITIAYLDLRGLAKSIEQTLYKSVTPPHSDLCNSGYHTPFLRAPPQVPGSMPLPSIK